MRNCKEREDDRGCAEKDCGTSAAGRIGTAGGEASDPQLCLWGSTRVSADKAVAPSLEEFKLWLTGLEVGVAGAHKLPSDR